MSYINSDILIKLMDNVKEAANGNILVCIHMQSKNIQLHKNCEDLLHIDCTDEYMCICGETWEININLNGTEISYDEIENGFNIKNDNVVVNIDFTI